VIVTVGQVGLSEGTMGRWEWKWKWGREWKILKCIAFVYKDSITKFTVSMAIEKE
jgi:hypothetical protein